MKIIIATALAGAAVLYGLSFVGEGGKSTVIPSVDTPGVESRAQVQPGQPSRVDAPTVVKGSVPSGAARIPATPVLVYNAPQRADETDDNYPIRVQWTNALMDWMADARLADDQRSAMTAALVDASDRFWVASHSAGLLTTEERMAEFRAATADFNVAVEKLLAESQLASFKEKFVDGQILISTRVVDTKNVREAVDQIAGPHAYPEK